MIDVETLKSKIKTFLFEKNCEATYVHCVTVGDYAYKLGKRYLEHPVQAQIAGYLHDVSAIYPSCERVAIAEKLGIQLCQEEKKFPMIIHQKISRYIAINEFDILNEEILSAIECHTTLKGNYSKLDLVVFVADKIKWDQDGDPPYLEGLLAALEISLEEAAFYYIHYLLSHDIQVIHPWLLAAYQELKNKVERK